MSSPSSSTQSLLQPQPSLPQKRPSLLSNITSPRARKQLTLFLAGSTFLTLSILATRRALTRRRLSIIPAFYHPSNAPPRITINGRVEALEALSLATTNALSFMMMLTGGVLWAADISSLKELKGSVRGGLGLDRIGKEGAGDREEWEEFEEWLASTLERKRGREKRRERERKKDEEEEKKKGEGADEEKR